MDILQTAIAVVIGGVVVMIAGIVIWNDVLRPRMGRYPEDQRDLYLARHGMGGGYSGGSGGVQRGRRRRRRWWWRLTPSPEQDALPPSAGRGGLLPPTITSSSKVKTILPSAVAILREWRQRIRGKRAPGPLVWVPMGALGAPTSMAASVMTSTE